MSTITIRILLPVLALALPAINGSAQQNPVRATAATEARAGEKSNPPEPQTRLIDEAPYRIGAGDVIDIKVFNKPQFSREAVKVDQRGMIRLPLINEVQATCLTDNELAAELTSRLKEYLRFPEVSVQIREYLSEPVAVQGAVRSPSRFQLQRRVRLLELLTFVNGPTDSAGRTIQIVHAGPVSRCEPNGMDDVTKRTDWNQVDYYKLAETLRGDPNANPYVEPGDIVSIAVADQVYVIGNVIRPTSIALTGPMTVARAIAMAGGPALDTKKSEIKIIRQTPGSTEKKEIVVDLDAINKHKAEDVVLLANDIVDVPASGSKRLFRSLLGAVIPSIGQLPVRAIP
jgi:polysaccharide export outer membrane protein